jgi:hypothetical protein
LNRSLTTVQKDQSHPNAWDSRRTWLACGVFIMLAVLYIGTLRDGHRWGDDFAHYIMQAESIAKLEGITAPNYVVNPDVPTLAPQNVPPGASVLLAPVYKIWGLALTPMKIWFAVLTIAGFVVFYLFARLFLPSVWALAAVLISALNPTIFDSRDDITPEKPYYLLSFGCLYLMAKAYQKAGPRLRSSLCWGVPLGLLLYASYATRNLAVALIAALPIYDVIQRRRPSALMLVALSVTAVLGVVHTVAFSTAASYSSFFNFSPLWIASSSYQFVRTLVQFLHNGYSVLITVLLAAVFLLLAAVGIWRTGIHDPAKPYIAVYWLIISAYFAPGYALYLYPLFPLFVMYSLVGLRSVLSRISATNRLVVASGLAAALVLTYGSACTRLDWKTLRTGIADPAFQRLVAHIQTATMTADTLLFFKPRALAMLTGRRSMAPSMPVYQVPDPERIWATALGRGVTHVIIADVPEDDAQTVKPALEELVRWQAAGLRQVFSDGGYRMYRIASRADAGQR